MFTTLKHWLGQVRMQNQLKTQATSKQPKPLWSLLAPLSPVTAVLMLMLIGANTAQAATASRASAFEYDPVSGLLIKEIIEPDNSALCLVTSYTYDSFGNKTSATTRNCNGSAGSNPGTNTEAAAPTAGTVAEIVARTSSTTYDTKGQFPISSTNALNQTETKTYNPNFGTVATLTGPNNLSTTWTYDSFGKPLTEARADGTSTSTAYALCTTGCATVGTAVTQYTITTTQAGAPYSRTYYDMNGRAIQSETQDKDGALILTQVQFDKLGRTAKTSRPFKAGTGIAVWNTVAYDLLNRPVTNTAPNNTVTSVAYNGYTTTTTNALSQTKTEIKNSQGQLVTVTDTQAKSLAYQYDAFGNLTKTTDTLGNITSITYDVRGRKIGMDDPDQGVWSYQYDALGQLKQQTDAKLQVVTFTYDKLGRMTNRAEPDLISTWAYDTCDAALNPGGKCIGKPVKETTDNGYVRTYLYDAYGRHTAELDNIDQGYGVTKSFDAQGRVSTLVYPAAFSTRNVYSASGYLIEVRNASSNVLYWQAGTTDNEGRITQQTYGNGIITNTAFDPLTGRISTIKAGGGTGWDGTKGTPLTASGATSVTEQSYVYDNIGNITQRYDTTTNLNEAFGYDSLNRLTSTSAQAGAGPLTQTTVTYNAIGNIMSKSDIGTYIYASLKANGSARPHAVSQIMMNDGTTIYGSYTYDASGNQTSGAGRTLNWNSWNMVTSITGTRPAGANVNLPQNTPAGTTSSTVSFVYNATHERVKETLPNGTIVYNISPRLDTGIHAEKRVKPNGDVEYRLSMYAGGMPFAISNINISAAGAYSGNTTYLHTDHLGSVVAVSDQVGNILERRSYDAWGKRRNTNGTSMNNAFVTPDVRYAFAGQEDLGEVGLVNMNGRVYDPAIGRFISADPTIEMPDDMQNYNRYSYINNNPLSAIDYSGYGFWRSLFRAVTSIFSPIKAILHNTVLRTIASIAVSYYLGPGGYGLFGTGSIANSAFAGFVSGLIAGRGDLRAAISGAITGGAFNVAGGIENVFGNVAAHAFIGCASSVAGGGKCGSGALSAGFGAAAANSGFIKSSWGPLGGTIASAVIGGTASVLGGGKFENGAVTAAFGYLFNALEHPKWQIAENTITDALREKYPDLLRQVRITLTVDGKSITAIADYAYSEGNTIVFGEIKDGLGARFTTNQKAVYDAIVRGNFQVPENVVERFGLRGEIAARLSLHATEGSRVMSQATRMWIVRGVATGLSILSTASDALMLCGDTQGACGGSHGATGSW